MVDVKLHIPHQWRDFVVVNSDRLYGIWVDVAAIAMLPTSYSSLNPAESQHLQRSLTRYKITFYMMCEFHL